MTYEFHIALGFMFIFIGLGLWVTFRMIDP